MPEKSDIQTAFHHAFDGPMGDLVLAVLADYCFARKTTAVGGTEAMAVNEGRRQVYIEIQRWLMGPKFDLLEHQAKLEKEKT